MIDGPCVYLISDGLGHCKVGRTDQLKKRFYAIQVSNPMPLCLIDVIPCDSLEEAKEVESQYHQALSERRLSGEWFFQDAVEEYHKWRTGGQQLPAPDYGDPYFHLFAEFLKWLERKLTGSKNKPVKEGSA